MTGTVALALVLLSAIAADRPSARDEFRVVGYLPFYQIGSISSERAKHLTDLVYFAPELTDTGEAGLDRIKPEALQLLKSIRNKHGVRIHLGFSGKNFPKLAESPPLRRKFAAEVAKFCVDHSFSGTDIDWEYPRGAKERENHGQLLALLKKTFEPHHLRLTIAVSAFQNLSDKTLKAVDAVHLMSYDAKGRHSTYEDAERQINQMLKKGVPAEKLILGLPCYARAVSAHNNVLTYDEIIKKHDPAPDVDEVDGFYFNGIKTIERKTRLALDRKLAGVMIWEIGQDCDGPKSLRAAIQRTCKADR